jgi:hypothetical protein
MIAQLTKNERQLALIILFVLSVCGFAMAAAGGGDPLGIHGAIVLLAGILGAFGVISGYYDPEPGNDRLGRYFDDPSRMGIILAMVWVVAGLFVGDWIAWQLVNPDLTFDAAWSSFGRLRPVHTSAGAIAEAERAFESFDVPKGTLRGSPPVPEDDLTTLRTTLYLVANKKLSSDVIATLTQTIMNVRRDLMGEQPILAQITDASIDPDAYLAVHPGAAAYYNGTQQSFMDKYGDDIYLAPMILGGVASVLAAAWKFLGIENPQAPEGPLDSLYALARRIRKVESEAELADIEDEIDNILKAQRARAASGDENAVDTTTLNIAAHRLEGLIHDRRAMLVRRPVTAPIV